MSYFGGKSGAGVFQTLINLMPPHEVYIEPFLGGAAVMRLKRPAVLNIGIDVDAGVIAKAREAAAPPRMASGSNFPRSLIAEAGEFRRRPSLLEAIPPGQARAAARARTGDTDLTSSHGDAVPRPGPTAVSSDSGSTAWTDDRGLHWQLRRGCGIEFLEASPLQYSGPGVLIYCDPPYLHSTRASHHRYAHEMTDLDHRRLLRCLRSLDCRVMISGYSSAVYAKELKGWNATAFQAATRGAPAAEWVWYNFDRPVELHDYRFLGGDFRERERIRRKQRRWSTKLKAMPLLERQALLSVLSDIR